MQEKGEQQQIHTYIYRNDEKNGSERNRSSQKWEMIHGEDTGFVIKKKKREREAEIVNISVTGNILKRSSLGREPG